jgi:hypothetical protein
MKFNCTITCILSLLLLLLLFKFGIIKSSKIGLDDDLHFDLNWKGALTSQPLTKNEDVKVNDDYSTEAQPNNIIILQTNRKEKYQCYLPDFINGDDKNNIKNDESNKKAPIQIQPLIDQIYKKKICSYRVKTNNNNNNKIEKKTKI